MHSKLSFTIAVFTLAGVLAAPLNALGLHRACMKAQPDMQQAAITHPCCSISATETAQPAVVATTPELPMDQAVAFAPRGAGILTRMNPTPRVETSPPYRALLDLPTLFGTLLI